MTSTVEERLKTIEGLIRSRTQIEQVITDFNLFPVPRCNSMDNAVAAANKALTVEASSGAAGRRPMPGQVTAFTVGFAYPDRDIALKVTQRLTDNLIAENSRMRETAADQTSQFLQSQLADAERRLRSRTRSSRPSGSVTPAACPISWTATSRRCSRRAWSSSSFPRASPAIATAERPRAALPGRGPGSGERAGGHGDGFARPERRPERHFLGRHGAAAARPGAQQPDRPRAQFKPEHPDVKRAKSQIHELEQQAAAEAANRPATSGGDAEASTRAVSPELQGRRERLREQKEEINSLGRQNRAEGITGSAASRADGRLPGAHRIDSGDRVGMERADARQHHAAGNLQDPARRSEIEDLRQPRSRQIGEQFRMLDAPRIAADATGARRIQINAGGLVLGLVLGLAIVAFREFTDSSFRTEADVFNVLALPVLAAVPFAPTAADVARDRRQQRAVYMTAAAALAVGGAVAVYRLWQFIV